MKFPKPSVTGIIEAVNTTVPLVSNVVNEKQKEKQEKLEQEKKYADQKHNGMVKYASILFLLTGLVLSIFAAKQLKILLSVIGILAVVFNIITYLYCLDIITEKKDNIYKVVFMIGAMLLVIVATLLFL